MKTNLHILLVTLLLSLGLASCAGTPGSGGVKPYPLKVCLVTGNDLNSMGGPVSTVYNGQEIKFCCKPCLKKFEANPAKYLVKL
jgi:YHS domain-containing protein